MDGSEPCERKIDERRGSHGLIQSPQLEVKLHTKVKHKILTYYFSSGWKNVFKSGRVFSLTYVDLFSGDGICNCTEIDENMEKYFPEDSKLRTWNPSFFDLMKYAKEADFNLKCYFNDVEEEKTKLLTNEINIHGYSKFVKEIYCKDANEIYKTILNEIENPKKPTLFYIDPTNHAQLSFSTIEGIAKFKDLEKGRQPELIINFMLNSIYMAMKRGLTSDDVSKINRFLGTNYSRKKMLNIFKDESEKTYVKLLKIYLKKLKDLGYFCNYLLIKSTSSKSPIYYLIFATSDKKIFQWYEGVNSYAESLEEEWIKKNFIVKTMTNAKKKGQKFLEDFM